MVFGVSEGEAFEEGGVYDSGGEGVMVGDVGGEGEGCDCDLRRWVWKKGRGLVWMSA